MRKQKSTVRRMVRGAGTTKLALVTNNNDGRTSNRGSGTKDGRPLHSCGGQWIATDSR
jgi:hypothetical protein